MPNSQWRRSVLFSVGPAIVIASTATLGVHLYVERRVPWRLEVGVFTIYLNPWVGQPSHGLDPPSPEENAPHLAAFCRGVIDTLLPRKCVGTRRFDIWCSNGPFSARGWPFLSFDYGFHAELDELDCVDDRCPRVFHRLVGQDGKSRFLAAGLAANWVSYLAVSLPIVFGVRAVIRRVANARMRRRRGFPVMPLNSP